MIAQEQFIQIYTDCQVEEVNGSYQIKGSFQFFVTIDPSSSELDDIVEQVDNAGQGIFWEKIRQLKKYRSTM